MAGRRTQKRLAAKGRRAQRLRDKREMSRRMEFQAELDGMKREAYRRLTILKYPGVIDRNYYIPPGRENPRIKSDWRIFQEIIPPRREELEDVPPELWAELPIDRRSMIMPPPGNDIGDLIREVQIAETCIYRGLLGFVEAGRALRHVHQRALWQVMYKSFKEYCKKAWKISKAHAYRLILAAKVVDFLYQQCGQTCLALPVNEAQVRPLTYIRKNGGDLDYDNIFRIWIEAQYSPKDTYSIPIITAKRVELAAATVMGPNSDAEERWRRKRFPETISISVKHVSRTVNAMVKHMNLDMLADIARALMSYVKHKRRLDEEADAAVIANIYPPMLVPYGTATEAPSYRTAPPDSS